MTVTVQSALTALVAAVRRLSETTGELALIATEDQPRDCQVHLVAVVHDAALDAAAEAGQAEAALASVGGADGRAAHAVALSQQHIASLGEVLARGLAAPDFLNDLAALGRERGRETGAWVLEISRCVQACQIALWTDVQPALLAYWQEITDPDRGAASTPSRGITRKDTRQ
jgi:hypothetical protein